MLNKPKAAVVFDWDKTLSPVYAPTALFKAYDIDERAFWTETNHPDRNIKSGELAFMLQLSQEVRPGGRFPNVGKLDLKLLGRDLPVYPGVSDLLIALREIGVETYIVTSGVVSLIEAHPVTKLVTGVFASDYADEQLQVVSEVITPMEKVRALYEISKGSHEYGIHPTADVPKQFRRIPFDKMIYVGDGPTDAYAFSKVKNGGGLTVGVWDPEIPAGFDQVERMREAGRLSYVGQAQFHPHNHSTGFWIYNKCLQIIARSESQAHREETEHLRTLKESGPKFVHTWTERKL